MKTSLIMIVTLALSTTIYAKSTTQTAGDILAAAIPAAAFANAYFLDDKEGEIQLIKSYATTIGTTMALKYTVREKRPDTDEHDSFPSGHTSSAFSGASFIHMRYGWKYALLPYATAAYTGYTRIHSNRHHTQDVLAGAALAIASSWYFTTPYKGICVQATGDGKRNGLQLSYKW